MPREPRETTDPKTNPCSNCGADVLARRRSATGKHWCSKPACRTERAKFYRSRDIDRVKAGAEDEIAKLVGALNYNNSLLAHVRTGGPRVTCPHCGATDAINGFPHAAPEGGTCKKLVPPQYQGVRIMAEAAFLAWPRLNPDNKES